jgi:hypothetical protein
MRGNLFACLQRTRRRHINGAGYAATLSSFSVPRMTIFSAPSGSERWRALASPQAHASKHRAPLRLSGSQAWPWDGLVRLRHSVPLLGSRKLDVAPVRLGLTASVTVQMPAKQQSGRLSSRANHTTSFFFRLRVRLWNVLGEAVAGYEAAALWFYSPCHGPVDVLVGLKSIPGRCPQLAGPQLMDVTRYWLRRRL